MHPFSIASILIAGLNRRISRRRQRTNAGLLTTIWIRDTPSSGRGSTTHVVQFVDHVHLHYLYCRQVACSISEKSIALAVSLDWKSALRTIGKATMESLGKA
jgi:hypothetical protein